MSQRVSWLYVPELCQLISLDAAFCVSGYTVHQTIDQSDLCAECGLRQVDWHEQVQLTQNWAGRIDCHSPASILAGQVTVVTVRRSGRTGSSAEPIAGRSMPQASAALLTLMHPRQVTQVSHAIAQYAAGIRASTAAALRARDPRSFGALIGAQARLLHSLAAPNYHHALTKLQALASQAALHPDWAPIAAAVQDLHQAEDAWSDALLRLSPPALPGHSIDSAVCAGPAQAHHLQGGDELPVHVVHVALPGDAEGACYKRPRGRTMFLAHLIPPGSCAVLTFMRHAG